MRLDKKQTFIFHIVTTEREHSHHIRFAPWVDHGSWEVELESFPPLVWTCDSDLKMHNAMMPGQLLRARVKAVQVWLHWGLNWGLRGHFTRLIWGWKSRCRSLSPSCPPSRSSPCLSRPRRRQCPPGTWRASGRRKDRRKICTRPGSWSARGRCDWATGSVWWGDREEAERPTDLRGGRGTGTNDVSIGRQRVRVRREKEWAVGESTVTHQQATSELDQHKEETEQKKWKKCVH